MKKLKKFLSILALIILVGSDFLTSFSYALEDILQDSEVVQIENEEETGSVGNEEKNIDEEDSEDVCEGENMGEEELETENSTRDVVEEGTGEVSEIGSGEIEELTEETLEGVTGDIVEELTGEIVESTGTGEETLIEEIKYNEELIIGEETYNDVTVRVEALTGIFPEGTELVIEPIKWWNLSNLKDKLVEEKEEIKEDTTIVAFDITFKYEGEEVQPKDGESVQVTFDYSDNKTFKNAEGDDSQIIEVYHVNDKDENGDLVEKGAEVVEKIEINQEKSDEVENEIVVYAENFSIYVLSLSKGGTVEVTHNSNAGVPYTLNGNENFTAGTITITDGTNTITMLDRNLGATVAGVGCKGSSCSSTDSTYGYYFQWGNNYGFDPRSTRSTSSTQVEASSLNYDPLHQQYFSSSTFIRVGNKNWLNDNSVVDLWGGSTGDYTSSFPLTQSDAAKRRGPCPENFHVPSYGEINQVKSMMGNNVENTRSELLIPFAGYNLSNFLMLGKGTYLWSSSPYVETYYPTTNKSHYFHMYDMDGDVNMSINTFERAVAGSVRCFYDLYQPYTPSSSIIHTGECTMPVEYDENAIYTTTGTYTWSGDTWVAPACEIVSCSGSYYLENGVCISNIIHTTDDTTTTTVGSNDPVEGLPTTITVIENDILESPEGEELSEIEEIEGKELVGDVTIDFGGDAIFSHLVQVNIPVTGSSKAYVKVKHVGSDKYNYDGLTRNIEASCDDAGRIVNTDDMYTGAYIDVESGYVSIYTCEASNFAAFGLPKVTFEPNNGDDPIIVEVESGATVDNGDIPNVSNSGLDFAGWYTSTDGGQTLSDSAFDFDTPITGNITLYAKWNKNKRITDQMPNFTWGEISISRPESISTGPESYIIMDRNLGATSSGTVCDTGSNNGTCGLLYQFGNNYGFSYGSINMAEKCNEKSVDLRDYSPSNPYYDPTFIKGKRKCNNTGTDTDWAAISNYNIWGGQNGSYTDRQGPCPDEWHLPTQKEWEEAIDYWTVGESDQGTGVLNSSNIDNFRDYFQLPFAGGRSRSDGKISHVGAQGSYDTAQTNKGAPYILRITTTGGIVNSNSSYNQVNGYSVRCFKNIYEEEYYTVTFKNRDGDILRSGEVVAGETPFYSGSQPSRPATEQNIYSFNGWYPEITPVTSDAIYTAIYNESPRLYTVTFTGTPAGYGTLAPESLSKEYETAIIISGNQLTIGGEKVTLTGNEGYEFQEWTGTCGKVEKQVCDEFTVYSHPEPIEFTGGNNLIITNLGYDLFSESNYQKDFEISFDIVEQNLSSSVSQATILNVKDEDQEDIWPGFVIRKSGTAGKIEISAASDYGEGFQTKSYSLENLHSMKISRINSILYVSINGEANQKIYDYSGFYNYFTKPIVFGSSYKDSNHLFRPAKITLSNILIKSADNCYTGNVYVVTGDCQMTAAFSASDSYEVRIASNNTGYGTVSTESVTKPHGTSIIDNENGTLTINDVTVTVTTGTAPAGHTYTFSGWTFSSECGSKGNYAVAEGCTITGNFEETLNTYTVTFDLSGGSLTGDMTLTKEYTIETPTISLIGYEPERNGYTFTGWYRDGTLVTSMAGGETGDYTLVARWEAQERPIPVVVFMKMLVPGEYTDYDSNLEWGWGTVGELYTAPIEQFTHTGFYYEEDNENNVRSVIVSPNVDNEVHLYFSRIPYPLIITNAGEGISSTTTGGGDHLYEEPVTISVTPYTGWDFVSWSLSQGTLSGVNDLTQRTLSFNMPAEQVMISPILNHIEYTLSFDSASGTAVENQTYYYNDLLSGLDNAITTRTGYDFSGWYLSGVLYTSGSTMPAEDITLTAVWDINEYEVDASVATGGEGYLSGMGSTGISLTGLYDYATELVFIAIPELGYVFDYWKNGDTVLSGTDLGDGTNQLTVVVDQILDIIAFFKPADDTPYTVEHYQANVGLTGYDFVWSGTMYGTTNTQTNATGTDYEGFSLHDGDISAYQTGIKADGSTVVRLYYDRNRYIVTWNTWNGFEVTKTDVAYGQHPHFDLTPPKRDVLDSEDEDYDFTFTGWTRSGVSGIVDLETEIVTGDITYTAEYDRTLKYYTVKYYPGEGTGIMPDQTNLQLHTSGNLIKNTFTRTGYIFSGRYSSMGLRYEDEQEINMGRADGFEYDLSGNFFLSLEAQWKPSTDTKVTVNYYLKNLDVENNVLTGGSREYLTGVEFTGTTDDIVDILTKYGTGIEGYEYSKSIVYGPDFPGGVETGTTTILADGDRVIEMYYVPKKYNFTLNTVQYSSTAGSSESTGYYYGAKVTLGGDSSDDCFMWSGWTTTGITLSDNTLQQTWFTMPANNVTVASSVREKTYDVTFNGGDGVQGSMESLSGVVCTENITLNNNFSKTGYTFTGWSTTSGGTRSYTSGQVVSGLSKNDGENVNLYAIWDINQFDINVRVTTGDEGKGYLSGMGSVGVSLTGLYDFGETLVVIAVPELGYLFDYWEVNESTELPEGVTASGNQLTVVVDQILDVVAHFKENVGTVTVNYYEMNTGGTYPGVANTATFTGLVGYTGYATLQPPVGFYLDITSTVNTGIVISENNAENVINIYYARNKHNITLGYAVAFLNPGSVTVIPTPRESGYYYGEDVHFEAIVSTGYVFKQWRVNGVPVAGGADGVDFVMGDEDVNLVVDGDLITYNIDYYTDPGSTDPYHENPHSYTVLSGEITINEPIAEFCHNFLGWTGGTTGDWILTPTTGLVIDSSKGGDRKYYANWERKSYDVELSVDPSSGGTVTGAGTYRCMGEIELHATSNTGYHFVGWYDTGGNLVSSNSMYFFRAPVGSLGTGLIAKFERNQYYVTIDKNGSGHFWGESAPSGRYYHGTPITFIASPSNGYKIQKWTRNRQNIMTGANNELYTGYILDVTVTETGNYEVYFEPETYNIIYMDSGSILTGLSPTTYTVENHVYSGDLPSITKDGYIFAGWFYEYPRQPQYQIQEIGYVPVDGQSVTILAGWMPIDYNICYHLLTGVETIPWEEYYPYESYQSYNIETVRTNLPRVEKDGYIFSGWVDNYGKSLTGFGGGMTGDLDLYPTWKSDVMDITVNYYEMDTNGDYSYIYETYNYTGLTDSTFYVPDYSKTGFTLHYYVLNGTTYYDTTPSLVVSGNTSANVIDVYYQRAWNSLQIYTNNGSNYSLSPYCQSFDGYNYSCSYYYGTEITINNYIWNYDEGYSFSGWNIDSEYSLPDDAYLSDEGISFLMPDHPVYIGLETNHILYRLTFTGYEGADVMNADSMYVSLTGENYYRFDSEIELPYLDKPGYNFMGWNSGDYNEWSSYYSSDPYHPIRHMPSHDVELTAEFSPRTDMEYYKYYYFQDTEGTGYSLSGYDRYEDGTTDQRVSSNCTYVEGFTHSRGEPDILYIKATGDNYINCYYDRDEYMVDVIYDDSKLSISGTGYYRYEAPVNLTATVKTGYEFSGFSSEWSEYNTTDSTLSFNVPLGGSYPIYAYAKPIVYSIEYEMYGGWLTPYQWYITGYTVDGDYDLGIFDAVKDGYTFLGWTGGEIGVREVTEPTKGLVIPLGSIGNRKYFANFQPNEENVVVNYYLKKIDAENNTLTGGVDIYLTGVVFTGLMDDVINISGAYLKEIEGYHYDHATVYSGEDEITAIETTILANGSREINMYYIPNKYNFTLNSEEHSSIESSSESTGYYYGAKVALSGDSNNDCYIWSGWITNGITLSDNTLNQTGFTMPANNVIVTPSVREMTYNIVFSGNGSTSGEMSSMMGVRCTESTGLILNSFQKIGYRFTGWSTIPGSNTGEYTDGQSVSGLSKNDGVDVNLYAVWDANDVSMHIFHLSETLSGNTLRLETESVLTKVGFFYSGEVKTFTGFRYNPLDSRNITGRIASWDGSQNEILLYYTRDEYPVTITNEGEGTTSETTGGREYLYEEPVTVSVKAYTGWEFVNWTVIEGDLSGANLSGTTLSFSMPAEQVQISPNLNHIPYTVYFNSASGTAVESQTYYYDDLLSGLDSAVTTRSGYSFSGWYLGDVLYNADSKMPAENITLTAKWKAETGIQYQVNHRGENIEGTAYNVLLLNETKYGETDARTLANSGEFEGFTLSGDVEQKKINPSGTTVVDIYYSRNKYLISFKDGDGNIIQSGMVAYGDTPIYSGDTPTKTATAQYSYTFNDTWSPAIEEVTTGAAYTAQFDKTTNSYSATISSNNTDFGTVSPASVTGLYGSTIEISGNILTISGENVVATPNDATAQYSYAFSGWNNTCGDEITGNCTITAEFTRTVNKYLIIFKDGDGNVTQSGMVAYGETPEYTGATPTKTATAQYSYTFNDSWSPAIEQVTTGATYTAQFNSTVNKYLITFVDGDGKTIQTGMVAYGETPEYTGATPTKTATAQYSYTFNDTWSPAIEQVTTGATYTAQFDSSVNKYLITFKDGDGNTIQTGMVAYGETPEYTGATPTKTATAQYTYTFNDSRSPELTGVTAAQVYTAQFDSTVNEYLITFVDGDGNTIQSGMVAYGDTPIYSGATPTKTATAQYSYIFNDTWSPAIEEVTTGATYTAQFDSSINSYTINVVSNDTSLGTISTGEINVVYGSAIVESGNKITIGGTEIVATPNEPDAQYTYGFDGWTNTCGSELTGTCTIQANFKKTLNKYTITWKNEDGTVIDTTQVAYGTMPTHVKPTKAETEDYRYVFAGWTPELTKVVGNAEYTATFTEEEKEKSSGGNNMSGGGGRRGKSWKTENSDNQHGAAEDDSDLDGFTGDNTQENVDAVNMDIYKWARQYDITTMDTIEEANPDGPLTRGHMAKMITNFAQNVLGKHIPTTYPDKCNWNDKESERESPEIKEYAKKACALGLMGIYVDEFMPNKILDRAEFGTIVSRLLWGDTYNIIDTDHRSYYEDHLRLLKKNGILTQIDDPEERLEIRKWVWLVFRRISERKKD